MGVAQKDGCEEGGFGQWKGNTYVLCQLDTSPGVAGKPHMFGRSKANGSCKPIYTPRLLIKHALESKHTKAGVDSLRSSVLPPTGDRLSSSDLVTGPTTMYSRLSCKLPRF